VPQVQFRAARQLEACALTQPLPASVLARPGWQGDVSLCAPLREDVARVVRRRGRDDPDGLRSPPDGRVGFAIAIEICHHWRVAERRVSRWHEQWLAAGEAVVAA